MLNVHVKMGKSLYYFLFLLWLCYLVISSILLFTNGFLLSRTVQETNSTCLGLGEIPCDGGNQIPVTKQCSEKKKLSFVLNEFSSASRICLPPKAKVILLIVDALRYDFTLYDNKIQNPLPYQNKLPVISKLRNMYPDSTRLYRFIADPPTTTMQRLKALTTGSLPTFIDAGSNFATSEITEDNLIDQILRNNHNVVFMGDDTWNGLYPNRFIRNYPYPSFNVWDLDTVDYGVTSNLFSEINKTDWSLLIGHFLGVDHCGHRYGPNNPEMSRKLGEINEVIENVTQSMDDDTFLFVIGDHGMTATGDHGGESEDETSAALFLYSKQQLLSYGKEKESVKQVDLVPTLATLLGVPIPFQNLGVLIVNCLPVEDRLLDSKTWRMPLFLLWANVQQVLDYIKEYSLKQSETFNPEELSKFYQKYSVLNGKIHTINSNESFMKFSEDLVQFTTDLRAMCEKVWVQFDSFSMARGLLFLFLSIFFVFLITDGIPIERIPEIFNSSFLLVTYLVLFLAVSVLSGSYFLGYIDNLKSSVFFATGMLSQVMLAMLVLQNWELISLNWYSKSQKDKIPNLICRLVLILSLCGLFSNSYIIEESFVLLFLLITVILIGTISVTVSSNNKTDAKRKNIVAGVFKLSKVRLYLIAFGVAVLIRSSMYYWRCRSEQQWCFSNPHEVNNVTAKMETTKLQWAITVIGLGIFVFITKEWLKNCGNLNGYSITTTFVKFVPTVIVVCTAGFWVLKRVPVNNKQLNSSLKSVSVLAWVVYSLTFLGIFILILKPLCTYILPRKDDLVDHSTTENVIPKLHRKIKNYIGQKGSDDDIPVICGLGTVYSSVFIMIGLYLTLLFGLLLGDAVALSAVIMFLSAAFVLIITSVVRIEKARTVEELFEVPNMSVLIWTILSQYFFYASGHQPSFPNITWEAAFVGTSGMFSNNFVPGALIIINTFCSHILMGVLLPLVLITPFTIFIMIPSVVGKKPELQFASVRGEVLLFERDDLMLTSMLTLSSKYIMSHAVRVFASMLSATIHCRHLMVWNIFAPKLIFESIGMLVTLASVLIGYLILIRINKKVESLVVALNKLS